jgi:hypothetical protein
MSSPQILIISNQQDATADFFEERLRDASMQYARLDTEHLCGSALTFTAGGSAPAAASLAAGQRRVTLHELRAVYYRRPVSPKIPASMSRGQRDWIENETRRAWGGVLAAQPNLRWVNHPLSVSAANYKPEQLARAHRRGLLVPETLITNDPNEAAAFCRSLHWAVVAKPIGHGEVLGPQEIDDRIIYTNLVSPSDEIHMADVAVCPTLFQQAVSKDVDVRATVIDDEVVAVALHSQEREVSRVDCRRDNMSGMKYSLMQLPDALAAALVDLVRSYGLLYGAIDLIRDLDGKYWFLELNPAGQWAWLEQVAGAPISAALIRCMAR